MQGVLHDREIFFGPDKIPILIDDSKNRIVELRFKVGSRLLHVALRDENWTVIYNVSASAEQMLPKCECRAGSERRIEQSKTAVGSEALCVEPERKVRSTLELLVI